MNYDSKTGHVVKTNLKTIQLTNSSIVERVVITSQQPSTLRDGNPLVRAVLSRA